MQLRSLALAVLFILFPLVVSAQTATTSIILSPHFDDADLSLGGFISQHKNPIIVATFFAGEPKQVLERKWDHISGFANSTIAVSSRIKENLKALDGTTVVNFGYLDYQYRTDKNPTALQPALEKNIEELISGHPDTHVDVYGPSVFLPGITHPDHLILHNAFYAVALKHASDQHVTFYAYEDFPYVYFFNERGSQSLAAHLHAEHANSSFEQVEIPLTGQNVDSKELHIADYVSQVKAFQSIHEKVIPMSKKYMANRCSKDKIQYCEVVYKIGK